MGGRSWLRRGTIVARRLVWEGVLADGSRGAGIGIAAIVRFVMSRRQAGHGAPLVGMPCDWQFGPSSWSAVGVERRGGGMRTSGAGGGGELHL